MRVALVNPGYDGAYAPFEPLNLGFLMAFLTEREHAVIIIDEAAGQNPERVLDRLRPDLVGVTATTPLAARAYEILAFARHLGLRTVMGGPHASALPDEAARHADHVVVGEGEVALAELAGRGTGPAVIRGEPLTTLEGAPLPDRRAMDQAFYGDRSRHLPSAELLFLPRGLRLATLITSRGCPHRCIFCHNSKRPAPVRYMPLPAVLSEVRTLREVHGTRALFFMDDDLCLPRPRFAALCQALAEQAPGLIFAANARVTSLDEPQLRIARAAGLRQINLGIESGSQRILDRLGKHTTVAQAEQAVRMAADLGLLVYATVMIGSPGETEADLEDTRRFLLQNPIDAIGLSMTTPYPGTRLWDECQAQGWLPHNPVWQDLDMQHGRAAICSALPRPVLERFRAELVLAFLARNRGRLARHYLAGLRSRPALALDRATRLMRSLIGR